jgi:hypothetical protein
MNARLLAALLAAACLPVCLGACMQAEEAPHVQPPGDAESLRTRALEAGAKLLQDRQPLEAASAYLDGFHFANGDLSAQMEAHHYVTVLNEDVMQAVIYDGNGRDAKLIGVEYIISEKLYRQLPPDEKKLWHSHRHEVKSGQLVAPGLPAPAEKALMKKIVSTYGKTWHTWHTDANQTLPLGIPTLMMGFTRDGQLDPRRVADRDRRLGVDSARIARQRADIAAPPVDPAADAWQNGDVVKLSRELGSGVRAPGHAHTHGAAQAPARP